MRSAPDPRPSRLRRLAGYARWRLKGSPPAIERSPWLGPDDWHAAYAGARPDDGRSDPSVVFSIVCPIGDAGSRAVEESVRSALAQTHTAWELIIVLDRRALPNTIGDVAHERDPRVRVLDHDGDDAPGALNAGLAAARGEYLVFLDPGDLLDPVALEWLSACAPDADLVYTDEDVVDERGAHVRARFKPAWSPRLLLSRDYVHRLSCVRTALVREMGGLDHRARGAEVHDLLLRISETDATVAHIPFIAYHGSEASDKGEEVGSGLESARRSIGRRQWRANVVPSDTSVPSFKVIFDPPAENVAVKIVVPTRDRVDLLSTLVEGIIDGTSGIDPRLVIVDNGSTDPATLDYLEKLLETTPNTTVLRDDGAFNFSRLCNIGAREGPTTPYLLFLNNDVEVLDRNWLSQLLGWTESDPRIVAVGPKLLFRDGTIQHAGVVLGFRGVAGHYALGEPNEARWGSLHDAAREISCLTAACLLVRTSAFDVIGGFDESLPHDFQDVDLCLRLRHRLGGTLMYDPTFPLIHHQSATRGYAHEPSPQASEKMLVTWAAQLQSDPFYSPHLSHTLYDLALRPMPDDDASLAARTRIRWSPPRPAGGPD